MNHNILLLIVRKKWQIILREDVLKRLANNFSITDQQNFVFPTLAYLDVMGYWKYKKCKMCDFPLKNSKDFFFHITSSIKHHDLSLDHRMWLVDSLKGPISKCTDTFLQRCDLMNHLSRDWFKLYYTIWENAVNNHFYT